MKHAIIVLVVGLMFAVGLVSAQESPVGKAEVFGGYSTQGGNGQGGVVSGWNAALALNVHKNIGMVADFSGAYASVPFGIDSFSLGTRRHSFLFGPQVGTNIRQFRPFAHVLFGVDRFGVSVAGMGVADTGWATAIGGGLDVHVYKNLSLRLGQLDYLRSSHLNQGNNDGRFSTGIVIHLGR